MNKNITIILFLFVLKISFGQSNTPEKPLGFKDVHKERTQNETVKLTEISFEKVLFCKINDVTVFFESYEYQKFLNDNCTHYQFKNEIKDALIKVINESKKTDTLDISTFITEKVMNLTEGFLARSIDSKKVVILYNGELQKIIIRQKYSLWNNSRNSRAGRRYFIKKSKDAFLITIDVVS